MTAELGRWLAGGWLPPADPPGGTRVAAVIAVGIAVKLMDDVLDQEEDALTERPNVAVRLGAAAIAYALAALALAAALSPRDALSLFWASYAWGMGHGAGERLPLGLRAWQETALAVALAVLAAGLPDAVAALALIGSVQLLDDWVDLRRERARPQAAFGPPPGGAQAPRDGPMPAGLPEGVGPQRNWAARLGPGEALLAGIALGWIAAAWDPLRAAATGAVALAVGLLGRRRRPGGGAVRDGDGEG
ncbi:MAG TPA: hypothetical protein VIL40_02375 [Thermaerobacter sp.]